MNDPIVPFWLTHRKKISQFNFNIEQHNAEVEAVHIDVLYIIGVPKKPAKFCGIKTYEGFLFWIVKNFLDKHFSEIR